MYESGDTTVAITGIVTTIAAITAIATTTNGTSTSHPDSPHFYCNISPLQYPNIPLSSCSFHLDQSS